MPTQIAFLKQLFKLVDALVMFNESIVITYQLLLLSIVTLLSQTWFALRPLDESDSCCFLCPSFFNLRGNDVIHRNICWRGICWTGHNSFCCNQSDSPFGAARRRPKLTRRKPNIRKNRLVKMPVWPDWKFYDLRMQPVVLVRKLELPCSCPF